MWSGCWPRRGGACRSEVNMDWCPDCATYHDPFGDCTLEEVTHLAAGRLGPNGELYRACDKGPLDPVPADYDRNDNHESSIRLVFCRACVAAVRLVGRK